VQPPPWPAPAAPASPQPAPSPPAPVSAPIRDAPLEATPPAKPAPAAAATPKPVVRLAPKPAAAAATGPATISDALAAATSAKPAPKPARAPAGGYGVQIGAFSSTSLAEKGWNAAAAVAPGAMAGKGKTVEKIAKDGATLYRTTITGFATRDEAKALCGKLQAAGKNCFVK
jgi:cell division septation protein DedD